MHVECVPGLLVARLYIAGKDAVPETDLVQAFVQRVVAPDDADVQHVQVVVGAGVHAAVAVVMPVRNDHARDFVGVFRLDLVSDVVEVDLERLFRRGRLARFET